MAVKSFNIEEGVYKRFSDLCKLHGASMSKQVEFFMKSQIENPKELREDYLRKLDKIRKGRFVKVKNINDLL